MKVDEQGQAICELDRRVYEPGKDIRLGMIDGRLNRFDEKLGTLREEMNQKFDQIIALLAPARDQ